MIVDLDIPAVQIAVPVLHARFGGPRRAHLSTLAGRIAGGRLVTIGILAASHQVLVDDRVVETVTCDDPDGRVLEPGTRIDLPQLNFRADVTTCRGSAFDAAIDRLLVASSDGSSALAARFPNDPRALTAVALTDRGWHTTHSYPRPDGGVLVTTRTELR